MDEEGFQFPKKEVDITNRRGGNDIIDKSDKSPKPPKGDARTLAYIMKNQDQDLLTHISIPSPHVDTKELTPKEYQMKEVRFGISIMDMVKVLITKGLK